MMCDTNNLSLPVSYTIFPFIKDVSDAGMTRRSYLEIKHQKEEEQPFLCFVISEIFSSIYVAELKDTYMLCILFLIVFGHGFDNSY